MHEGWRSGGLLLNLRDGMTPEALADALSQTEPTNSAWCKLLGKTVPFHALTDDAL